VLDGQHPQEYKFDVITIGGSSELSKIFNPKMPVGSLSPFNNFSLNSCI